MGIRYCRPAGGLKAGKVPDKDAAILTWMSEVCIREPIKIHIHPVLKLLIRREEGIYIAITITV